MANASGDPSPKADWSRDDERKHILGPLSEWISEAANTNATIDLSFAVLPNNMIIGGRRPRDPSTDSEQRASTPSTPAPVIALNLDRATFTGAVFFQNLQLTHAMSFHGTTFQGRADFRGSVFLGGAFFMNARFEDIAQFMDVPFRGALHFSNASFAKSADFGGAIFGGGLVFHNAIFLEKATFSTAAVDDASRRIGGLQAQSCTFTKGVSFVNRSFAAPTDFTGSVFHIAPDFHGCQLHQATYFPKVEGFPDVASKRAASSYRALSQAMADMRAHDEEAMFFALQQRALRGERRWHDPIRIFSWFYGVASDYGQSLARPMALLATTHLSFLSVYTLLASCRSSSLRISLAAGASFSFQQLFRPFAIWTERSSPKWPLAALGTDYASTPLVLGTIQTMLSLAWLYLIGLGIRWRFRRW